MRDSRAVIRIEPESYSRINGSPQAGGFICVRTLHWQPENIGCQLHGAITLGSPTGNHQPANRMTTAFFQDIPSFTKRVGQPLDDRSIHMGTGMHITKTNNTALGLQILETG